MNRFLTILIILLCNVFVSAQAKDIRFAQVTDVNYRKSSPILIKIVKDINKTSDIDFVIFTGNNIGQANQANLKSFLVDIKKLKKPYYLVLGNKDISKANHMEKKTYMSMVRKVNRFHPKTPNYIFKKNNMVFLVVDGTKEVIPSTNGVYSKDTISWVDEQLSKYKANKVVIFQHFPIANKPANDLYYTYNALEYLQMLSKHKNVIAVISGHYRKNDEIVYNGVRHITSPQSANGVYKIIDIDVSNGYEVFTMLKEVH